MGMVSLLVMVLMLVVVISVWPEIAVKPVESVDFTHSVVKLFGWLFG